MHSRINEFVDGFVPKNLSKKKALLLKAELTCHIIDKADFYKEIGYDDMVSVEKAIEDFGTDEKDKNYIFNEFEELYSEKSVFAIASFLIITVMNYICFYFDLWVISADYNSTDPEPGTILISFAMIFLVLGMICFARVKKYRKMLLATGLANLLIAAVVFLVLYPQLAGFALAYNFIYLTDMLTPFSVGHLTYHGLEHIFVMTTYYIVLVVPAIYSLAAAFRIKRGLAKNIEKPGKKIGVFSLIYLVVAIVSSLLYPVSEKYLDDYRVWFSNYNNYISQQAQQEFDKIAVGESYSQLSKRLHEKGYVTIEEYKGTLDRITKKQFKQCLKRFDFARDYEIWFNPDFPDGNGFLGICQQDGVVIAKGVGNMEENMYDEKYQSFGYSDIDNNDYIPLVTEHFRSLEKGDPWGEVMTVFGKELGTVYAERYSVRDGKIINYYRVYCYGRKSDAQRFSYSDYDNRYIELIFENGLLKNATMYDHFYGKHGYEAAYEKLD